MRSTLGFCSLLQFLHVFLTFLQPIRFVLKKSLLIKQIIPDMSKFVLYFGEFRCEFGYFRGVGRCLSIFGRYIIICVLKSSLRSAVFLRNKTLSPIHTQQKQMFFTPVCHSVHGGGVLPPQPDHPLDQTSPWDHTPPDQNPWKEHGTRQEVTSYLQPPEPQNQVECFLVKNLVCFRFHSVC